MGERGKFVAVYGMNNTGKSTVAKGVTWVLDRSGVEVKYLKYPIYESPTGRRINDYLRCGNPQNLSPEGAQVLYAENRRQFEPVLRGFLDGGISIIAEDYKGTGICWGQIFDVPLERLEAYNEDLLEPDMSMLLDGKRFSKGVEVNHKHEGVPDEMWEKGRRIHKAMAARYSWRVVRSDQSVEQVLTDVLLVIDSELALGDLKVRGLIKNGR